MAKTIDANNPRIARDGDTTYITVDTMNDKGEVSKAELAFNFNLGPEGVKSATADARVQMAQEEQDRRRSAKASQEENSALGHTVNTLMGRVNVDPSFLGGGRLTAMKTAEGGAQVYKEMSEPPTHFNSYTAEGRARAEAMLDQTLNPVSANDKVKKLQAEFNTLLVESEKSRGYPLDVGDSKQLSVYNGSGTLLPQANGHPVLGLGLQSLGQGKYVDQERQTHLITSADTIRHELFHMVDPQFNKKGLGAQDTIEDRAVNFTNQFIVADGRPARAAYVVPLEGGVQPKDIPVDTYHKGVLADQMPGGLPPRPGNVRTFPEYTSRNEFGSALSSATAAGLNQHIAASGFTQEQQSIIQQRVASNVQAAAEQSRAQQQELQMG